MGFCELNNDPSKGNNPTQYSRAACVVRWGKSRQTAIKMLVFNSTNCANPGDFSMKGKFPNQEWIRNSLMERLEVLKIKGLKVQGCHVQ
jgi:hypothetical protein